MNAMKLAAMLLFGVAISILAIEGVSYGTPDKVVELGPLQVNVEQSNTAALLPMMAAIALFGATILLSGKATLRPAAISEGPKNGTGAHRRDGLEPA